jgi:predicted lipoprotein with Yx(FWY)xxD motif
MRTPQHRTLTVGVVCAVTFVALASTAVAGVISSLGTAKRTIAGKPTTIVVDRRGDTVYELSGESLAHLECVTSACLRQFTPVLVRSASVKVPVAPGVPGKVTVLRRVKANLYQVMLADHPLYFYAGDTKIGATRGQGLQGPGGTWHVVRAG